MILFLAILVVGAAALVFQKIGESKQQAAGQQEQKAQLPELQECRERMAKFYKAWSAYRSERKGADPPSIEALIPTYSPNADLLVCPTAARWIKKGKRIEQGSVTRNRRGY